MKHATVQALDALEDLLVQVRKNTILTEKKRGTFYHKSNAILHFHEDALGLFADLKVAGQWRRFAVNNQTDYKILLAALSKQD